ncbi:unnamed protein product [Vitrella brassicaformis CCMP3155]|uniref:Acyltransferase 3 domain-containing protein n=1 Tax=Vitrella brassicaformis (strain CCMP3155) TaxID=1169540 RepID=A0A0G4GCM2_VITBC|nr:unnamed protein product [Vitrella brassicaformis CCMP3155]|eukprot:CEM26546.1 unnamed protein product [Vitrella brassicaformis CCMP3155]
MLRCQLAQDCAAAINLKNWTGLPSYDNYRSCISASSADVSTKYCLGELTALGGVAGLTAGLCLPDHCTQSNIEEFVALVCAVPSCVDIEQTLQPLCDAVQATMCDPRNRTSSAHNFHLSCLESDSPSSSKGEMLDATLACGGIDPQRTLDSGLINNLGNWDACNDLPGARYCLASYAQIFITSGQCVASTCGVDKYQQMVSFACEVDNCMAVTNLINPEYCAFWKTVYCGARGKQVILAGGPNDLPVPTEIDLDVTCDYSAPKPETGTYVTLAICGVIAVLITAATVLSEVRRRRAEGLQGVSVELVGKDGGGEGRRVAPRGRAPVWERLLLAFSLTDNWHKMLSTHRSGDAVCCLDGLRSLSILWVLLGHTFLMAGAAVPLTNLTDTIQVVGRFSFQLVVGAFFAVDTFFFLSGFLLAYVAVKHATRMKTRVNVPVAIIHRWVRLSVLYVFVILAWEYLTPYMGNGPRWPQFTVQLHSTFLSRGKESACKRYWWANLLYINNFIPHLYGAQCMPWTWYLANDMQFFVVGILIIAIYCGYSKRLSWCCMGLLLVASWVTTGSLNLIHGWKVAVMPMILEPGQHQEYLYYEKPWCRIGPYLVGMAGGLLVLEHGRAVRVFLAGMTRFGRWACHLLCGAVMLFVIFIQYDANKAGAVPWTPLETMLYNTFARSVWGLCLLWLVVCCAADKDGVYAPWTNRLLSLPVFVPLARLTYAFYMIHLPLMAVWFFSRRDQDYYYDGLMAVYYPAFMVLGFAIATFCFLFVEAPGMNIDKIVLDRLMTPSTTQATTQPSPDSYEGKEGFGCPHFESGESISTAIPTPERSDVALLATK